MSGSQSALLGGARAPSLLVQANAANGYTSQAAAVGDARLTLSGALTANTLATLLNLSGSGEVHSLGVATQDGTARTIRAQLIVDGITVYDYTSGNITNVGMGCMLVGSEAVGAGLAKSIGHLHYNTSLVLKIASSLTETDKLGVYAKYWVF